MQEKFKPVILGFEEIVQNIVKLVLACQLYELPVIVTEQNPAGLGKTLGIIRSQFDPFEPVEKQAFSCVQDKEFIKRFNKLGLENVVVCGIESHVCINQTVLGLVQKKVNVHVVVDAISARRGLDHRMAMEKMLQAGAIPATTEMVLFELLGSADAPEFKKVQRMVKSRLKWKGGSLTETSTMTKEALLGTDSASQPAPAEEPAEPEKQPQAATPEPEPESEAKPEPVEESSAPMPEDDDIFETTAVMKQRKAKKKKEPEDEVIATVEVESPDAGDSDEAVFEKGPAEPADDGSIEEAETVEVIKDKVDDAKKKDTAAAIPEDIEVLDIEALVDLRDSSDEHGDVPDK